MEINKNRFMPHCQRLQNYEQRVETIQTQIVGQHEEVLLNRQNCPKIERLGLTLGSSEFHSTTAM